MVGIVVHLLVITEHFFFVRNLYASGNDNNFSMASESNIWDYVTCSRAKASRETCDVLLGSCNVPVMASDCKNPYQLQEFNFLCR